MASNKSSILIFEMNKKYLLFKILTRELRSHLRSEIWKNFGAKYVNEKNEQSLEFYKTDQQIDTIQNEDTNSASNTSNNNTSSNFNLTDDLIYEYFSALVASYEISREIDYVYEYALFEKNKYIVRFHQYKNFLIMILFNVTTGVDPGLGSFESTNQLYTEYHTKWFCKSIVSLIKYKFGISTDDRCLKEADENTTEIKSIFSKWSFYYQNENLYFMEAIEKLDVNADIRKSCELFVTELSDCLKKAEAAWSDSDDGQSSPDEDFQFLGQDEERPSSASKTLNQESTEFERFFSQDLSQINQFVFSFGGRLLHKNNLNIDSGSLFMLLLESAHFLDYRSNKGDSEFDENDEDAFESASGSVSPESPIEESEQPLRSNTTTINNDANNFNNNGNVENLAEESIKKPSVSETYGESFQSVLSTPFRYNENFDYKQDDTDSKIGRRSDLETSKSVSLNHKRCKLSMCFLQTATQSSTSLYEALFFKLSDNLCLILLKPNKLAKYCEILADFDSLLNDFSNQIERKRSRSQLTPNTIDDESVLNQQPRLLKRGSSVGALAEDELQRFSKAFYGFFVNKMLILIDKLKNLKADLANRWSSSERERNSSFFSRALSIKSKSRSEENETKKNSLENSSNNSTLQQDRNRTIKLINSLQVKIAQFMSSREFKSFMNGVTTPTNSFESSASLPHQSSSDSNNPDLRYIEYQLTNMRTNLNDLFYDLFLTKPSKANYSRSSSSKIDLSLKPKANYIYERLENFYSKSLFHYSPFIEIKLKRNVSIAYYGYLLPGLVHFSFINRQDNICTIPSIDPVPNYNLTEAKIIQTYRKYVPIVMKLLCNFECSEMRFWDDRLEIVFNYLIWFEDRGGNRIPVEFSRSKRSLENRGEKYDEVNRNNRNPAQFGGGISIGTSFLPGITERSFYDQVKSICYPNAPSESLTCYELFCLHSSRLREDRIDKQFKYLVANLPRMIRNNNSQ